MESSEPLLSPSLPNSSIQSNLKNLAFTIVLVVGGSCQTVVLPLWLVNNGKDIQSPYFILLLSSLFNVLFFGLLVLVNYILFRPSTLLFTLHWKIFLSIGLTSGLSEILIFFSSFTTTKRTPPLLQTFLLNTSILFSLFSTKIYIDEKKVWKFVQLRPILALFVLFIGALISIIPLFLNVINGTVFFWKDEGGVVWSLVLLLGIFFAAIRNVLQERFLLKRFKKSIFQLQLMIYDLLLMLFWSCLFQFITLLLLFWTDLIPKFGHILSLRTFFQDFVNFFQCFVKCPQFWLFGLLFNVSVVMIDFSSAHLNQESANYTMIATTLYYPIALLFWFFFPQFKSSFELNSVFLWNTIPSLILHILSCVLWKSWEYTEISRVRKMYELNLNTNVDTLVKFPDHPQTIS